MFKHHRYPKPIILQAVYFKLRFKLSSRDVEELLSIRGVKVDHSTLQRWAYEFTPMTEAKMHKRKRQVFNSWRMGETVEAPQADFTADKTTLYAGGFVVFRDASLNLPSNWEWTFEGGEPSFSTVQNPQVTYNSVGTYNVSLKVSNSVGDDSIVKTGYIVVTENAGSGNLQAHYEFDNGLIDLSSYRRDLAPVGDFTPLFTNDRNDSPNEAYQTPGNNEQYLTTGYKGIKGNSERTVTAWFKTSTSGPARKTIVSWGRNVQGEMFNLMVFENGRIRLEAGSCNVQSYTGNLNDNNWHHVAVTYDPADGDKLQDVKIYVDGTLDANRPDGVGESYRSEEVSINTDVTENNIRIGSVKYANYYFDGAVDDVRIYSTSLSGAEINDIYELKTAVRLQQENKKKVRLISGKAMIKLDLLVPEYALLHLYDIKGSLIRISPLDPGINQIEIKPGVYIARVKTNEDVESGKVISY